MQKVAFLLTLMFSSLVLGDDSLGLNFLEAERPRRYPFELPISISPDGDVTFFPADKLTLNFRPNMQAMFSRSQITYSHPACVDHFDFYPQNRTGFILVKRQILEGGLGLSVLQNTSYLGLTPYKGSLQTIIQHKVSSDEPSHPLKLPAKLSELGRWSIGDQGSYQTYGGISVFAGIGAGVNLLYGLIGIENQFLVELTKLKQDEVRLVIGEEDVRRREFVAGPFFVNANFSFLDGKSLSLEFRLDLRDPFHHQLYEEALRGNLMLLQEKLDEKKQKIQWSGRDRTLYVGIPVIAGRNVDSRYYEIQEDGEDTTLEVTGSRLDGLALPVRNRQDFIYLKDNSLLLIWASEMTRTSKAAILNRFLSIGRALGIKGFEIETPQTKFGSVITVLSTSFSRREFETIDDADFERIAENFRVRCVLMKLPCVNSERRKIGLTKLFELRKKIWRDGRSELGFLFAREPALLHAIVKSLRLKKAVYFKFLSQKHQSLEGSPPIEI